MIHSDSKGLVLLLEKGDKRFEILGNTFSNRCNLFAAELCSIWISFIKHEKAWIDPHLVDVFCHLKGNFHAVVMNVSH